MNISVHEQNNQYFLPNVSSGNTHWGLAWTAQQLVSATEVTATGGTYA